MNKDEVKQALADKIKLALKSKGLSRKEFALLMEATPSMVTKWLSGKHNFTLKTLFEIERKLDLQLFLYT